MPTIKLELSEKTALDILDLKIEGNNRISNLLKRKITEELSALHHRREAYREFQKEIERYRIKSWQRR